MERHPLQVSSRTATLSHILLLWNVADVKPYVQNKKVAAAAFLGTLCATILRSLGASDSLPSLTRFHLSLASRGVSLACRLLEERQDAIQRPGTDETSPGSGIRRRVCVEILGFFSVNQVKVFSKC